MPQTHQTVEKNVQQSVTVTIGVMKNQPPFVTLKHQNAFCVTTNLIGFQGQEMWKIILNPFMIMINPERLTKPATTNLQKSQEYDKTLITC